VKMRFNHESLKVRNDIRLSYRLMREHGNRSRQQTREVLMFVWGCARGRKSEGWI